ncbi:MAG: hypothetical protein ACRDLB_02585 [Actinomycetota bacterium]
MAFALVETDAHARAHLLEATGHRYFPLVAALLVISATLSVGAFVRHRTTVGPRLGALSTWTLFALMCLMQVGGYVFLEVSERLLVAHNALGDGFGLPIALAIATQLFAAALGAVLLKGVEYAIDTLFGSPAPQERTDGALVLRSQVVMILRSSSLLPVVRRGPPHPC